MTDHSPDDIGRDPSALPLSARLLRSARRAVGLDREARWNREYAEGRWDGLRNLHELSRHCVLAGYVATLKPGGAVLDVGCGQGVFQEQLRGAEGTYLGLDFEGAVALAKHKETDRIRFAVADMEDFTTEHRFDAIVFNESIYYMHDPVAGLRRYGGMLAPDGVMLVSMHHKERTEALWRAFAAEWRDIDVVRLTNAHGTTWVVKALGLRADAG